MNIRKLQESLEELLFVGQSHRLGVFSELYKTADTSDGLAERMGFDRRSTRLLLEALVEMRYLNISEGIYSVPDDTFEQLIDERGDEYVGYFWQFLLYLIDPWRTLSHVLRHGRPDESSYKNLSMIDFIKGMDSPWKRRLAPEIVDLCLKECKTAQLVTDIGGAPGTIAREFASRGIQTIIFDLPESIAEMREELSNIKNVTIQEGDATDSLPEGLYDIAFLGNLCHGQSPENNEKILSLCHDHLRDGGIIAIFDNIRGESYLGARLALHMMTQSAHGDVYTKEDYARWLGNAGFRNMQIHDLSDKAWHLLIATKQDDSR